MTAVDAFSKWAYAQALPEVKSEDIVGFIIGEIVCNQGVPKIIFSDRGSQFKSHITKGVLQFISSTQAFTAPYHPQANGADERWNRTIKKMIRNYTDNDQRNWDIILPWAVLNYNLTKHETTGFAPYEIVYGREAPSPFRTLTAKLYEHQVEKINRSVSNFFPD